jgi:hypothetical protein
LNNAVPDMPFKDPADYGRLEIKNSILDAIANGQHGVGISPYSPAGKDESGHTYQKIYPGELKKIANQYRGEMQVRDLPTNKKTLQNWNVLQDANVGDVADLYDTQGMNEYSDFFEPTRNLLKEMKQVELSAIGPNTEPAVAISIREARSKAETASHLFEHFAKKAEETGEDVDVMAADNAFAALKRAMIHYDSRLPMRLVDQSVKVPYAKITPEMKDRVQKYGLPLFSLAGAAALAPGHGVLRDQSEQN